MLDASGKKVKQYLESAKAFVPMTVKDKAGNEVNPLGPNKSSCHPCNCRSECIRWDQNGNCTGTYRTCDICC